MYDGVDTTGREMMPLLLKPAAAARRIGISRTQFYRWNEKGAVPLPVTVLGARYWRAGELESWIEAGCPGRDVWQAKWEVMNGTA